MNPAMIAYLQNAQAQQQATGQMPQYSPEMDQIGVDQMSQQLHPTQQGPPYNPFLAGSLAAIDAKKKSLELDEGQRDKAFGRAAMQFFGQLGQVHGGHGSSGVVGALSQSLSPALQEYQKAEEGMMTHNMRLRQQAEQEAHQNHQMAMQEQARQESLEERRRERAEMMAMRQQELGMRQQEKSEMLAQRQQEKEALQTYREEMLNEKKLAREQKKKGNYDELPDELKKEIGGKFVPLNKKAADGMQSQLTRSDTLITLLEDSKMALDKLNALGKKDAINPLSPSIAGQAGTAVKNFAGRFTGGQLEEERNLAAHLNDMYFTINNQLESASRSSDKGAATPETLRKYAELKELLLRRSDGYDLTAEKTERIIKELQNLYNRSANSLKYGHNLTTKQANKLEELEKAQQASIRASSIDPNEYYPVKNPKTGEKGEVSGAELQAMLKDGWVEDMDNE